MIIPYGKQDINQDDIDSVVEVLKSDFLTQGSKIPLFEKNLSEYCGVKYAKTVNNGTAALHLSILAVGVKKNDIVWVPSNTFVATANAAMYCGAKIEFVDIDARTYNISIECLLKKLIDAKNNNKLPKLVIPVHFAGQSCQMKEIWKLSQEYGFRIIEDACHALGGEYKNTKVGSCKYSDMAVFSFHPVKMITTGEGGAVVTNSHELDKKVELLRSHGITKDSKQFINKNDGAWYYEQHVLGYNYRLTDIQAALGISQLKRLDDFVKKRKEIARRYFNELKNVIFPYQHPDTSSSWHLFVIQVENRKEKYYELREQGIETQVHYIPVDHHPFYSQEKTYNSTRFYQKCLSIPIYPSLTYENQSKVINNI
jgi:UDP-4-amino-4,6-dideoxy-N-acetyl-beta-L-altrosamine transaminase